VALHTLEPKLQYEDLAHTPDDGRRYELLDGVLTVTPSPSPLHQRVSKRLHRRLEAYFEARHLGEVFYAPVDVLLGTHDVVVPDLVVVTAPAQITDRAIEGAPTLLVEILSPSTRRRDRQIKAGRYAAQGVPHYWIVDPVQETLECYRLLGDEYVAVVNGRSPGQLTHPDWPDLSIDLTAIWR